MFEEILEKIKRVDEIESKLLSIFEGKTWEYVAKALYQILDDIDTVDDMCKENVEVFRNVVMRLQAKKNQLLYSPDGHSLKKVNEWKEPSQEQLDKISQEMFGKDYDSLPVIMQMTVKDKAITKSKVDVDECVCHIYGMNDGELLEFYGNVILNPEHYASAGAQKQYPKDKIEVEEEISKRGLDVNINGKKFSMVGGIGNSVREFFDRKASGKDEEYLIAYAQSRFGSSKLSDVLCKEAINENLTAYARKELELAGLFDKDSDYDGMLGEAVMELIQKFGDQDHSGFSAGMTLEIFSKLANFKPLTEITDNPDEWMEVGSQKSRTPTGEGKLYQSRRNPVLFSEDGGQTYYDLDEMTDEDDNILVHQSKHIEKKE